MVEKIEGRRTFKASNVNGDKCVEFKFNFLNVFIPVNAKKTIDRTFLFKYFELTSKKS